MSDAHGGVSSASLSDVNLLILGLEMALELILGVKSLTSCSMAYGLRTSSGWVGLLPFTICCACLSPPAKEIFSSSRCYTGMSDAVFGISCYRGDSN